MTQRVLGRLLLLAIGVTAGLVTLLCGHSLIDGNEVVLRILVTTFSVLVGVLLAVLTIAGDPKFLYQGNWRVASGHRRQIRVALGLYQCLFYVYLSVILLVVLSALVGPLTAEVPAVRWIARVGVSLGVMALIWSFALPTRFIRVQMERIDDEVDHRRRPGAVEQPPTGE